LQRLGISGAISLPIPLPIYALMMMRGQPYLVTEFVSLPVTLSDPCRLTTTFIAFHRLIDKMANQFYFIFRPSLLRKKERNVLHEDHIQLKVSSVTVVLDLGAYLNFLNILSRFIDQFG
jgi:hypothetical protein